MIFFFCIYIFSLLTVPEFLLITLSSALQKDVRLTRSSGSGNPTRDLEIPPRASQHRQPLGLVGRGAQKRSHHQSLPPSPLPMIPLSVSERGEAWLPGTVEPTSIPVKHRPGAGCWWAPLPSVSCSTAKAGMMTAVLGCFMNLMHPLAKKGEGKNPGKYTSVSEIYTARRIWLEQSLGHIYITRLQ